MGKEFQFLRSEGVYRYKESGRKLSDRQLYAQVEKVTSRAGNELERTARLLQSGEISVTDWAISSGELIRDLHRAVALIAGGGSSNMTPSDWGFAGSRIRSELTFFNAFVNEVEALPEGAVLTDAFVARAASYQHAAYVTYSQALRRRHLRNGTATLEQNILESGAEHCEGCLAATAAGSVPIGTLTQIGARDCNSRCKCRIVYMREAN